MFYQIFLSPQVKRRAIISNKHGIFVSRVAERLKTYQIRKYQENLKTS